MGARDRAQVSSHQEASIKKLLEIQTRTHIPLRECEAHAHRSEAHAHRCASVAVGQATAGPVVHDVPSVVITRKRISAGIFGTSHKRYVVKT